MIVSSMLPQWSTSTLSDVTMIIRGVTYKKAQASNQPFTGSLAILRANNIQGGSVIANDLVYVPSDLVKPHQRLLKGDIVVAMSSGSKAVVGKTARIKEDFDGSFGAFCGVLRPVSEVIPTYLAWFTHSLEYRNRISSLSAGANINNLKPSHFDEIQIPLAPLAEQKIIADKLDTLLAQVENTKARLERIPKILKRFRQSVLAAAVSGRLTEEWTSTHLELGEVAEFQNGYAFKSGWFEDSGTHQVVKLGNIRDGRIALENSPAYVGEKLANEFYKYEPNPGDILISMTGTRFKKDYGFGCMIKDEKNLLINQRVGRVIPNRSKVSPEFLFLFVRSDAFRDQFFVGETGGVNQGNVGSKHILSILLELPTLDVQKKIVRRVDQLFAHANSIEQQVNNALARVNNLTQSILAKAFRGELTEQWRKDNAGLISGENSAEALLQRIKPNVLKTNKLEV